MKAAFASSSSAERTSHDEDRQRTNLSSSIAARRGMTRSKTVACHRGSVLHSLKSSAAFAVQTCSSLIEGSVKKAPIRRHINSEARAGAWIAGTADDDFRKSRRLSAGAIRKQVAAKMEQRKATSRRRPRWIIDPRVSQFMAQWDCITALALFFTAAVTPYEVGFVSSANSFDEAFSDPLFWMNRVVDCIFVFDLFLQFVLMYPTLAEGNPDGTWVDDPQKIFGHYLRTWFVPDVVSVAASAFDIAAISSKNQGEGRDLSSLQAVRMVRAFRLIKLVSILHCLGAHRALPRPHLRATARLHQADPAPVRASASWYRCV